MNLGALALELSQGSNFPIISAFLIGVLVSVSPCPLATNITAIAYISRRAAERKYAVTTAILYTLGRMFSYSVIGTLIIVVGLGVAGISSFLQDTGEQWLGPLLIVTGFLLFIADKLPFGNAGSRLQDLGGRVVDRGVMGGFFLGALFAMAFAIGTGLPVLALGILLSFSVSRVSSLVNVLNRAQPVIRTLVSIIFVGVGIYYVVLWIQTTGVL